MRNGQSEALCESTQGLLDAATISGASDGQLLSRFTAHRDEPAERAFATLVRRHGPMVLRVCQQILGDRHTAEDAFQSTFLILARRAGSIRQPELLGHWLYGVALRTAREARMRDDRRRQRESLRRQEIDVEPIDRSGRPERVLVCREEFEALHEEVSRLPERYRIPIVLCDLEGLTYQEAAECLRCPVGTIGVRLRRARERLRTRLTRRGLAPTAGLIGAMLGAETTPPQIPTFLVDSTVRAAMQFTLGNAAAVGFGSVSVIPLTEAVLRAMALTRLKLVMGVAIAIGVAATIGWVAPHRKATVLPATVQKASQTTVEATLPANLAAPEFRTTQPEDATPARSDPNLPELVEPRPMDEAPSPLRPAATILAAAPLSSPATNADRKDTDTSKEVGSTATPKTDPQIVPTSPRTAKTIPEEQERGAVLFAKEWVPDDPMSHGGDGLGPVYNDTSCVACHGLGAPGGAGPESKNVVLMTAAPNGCGSSGSLDQTIPSLGNSRSAVLHRYSTDPRYDSWRRRLFDPNAGKEPNPTRTRSEDLIVRRIRALKETTSPGHRLGTATAVSQAITGFNITLVERNTPALFGAGRIDEIPSEVLVAVAALQPSDVRGRISRDREGRIGRFGWKAQIPSLHEFVRGACSNELGLEVPGHSQAMSPVAPNQKARGLDLTEADCDAIAAYVRSLPAPVVVDPYGPRGTTDMRDGRGLFTEAGCVFCHTPTLGEVGGIYSDLLLHNMGQSLSDSGSTYGMNGPETPTGPSPREWRTPPLWGYRDSGPYLHDGRARNLEEAVALHEGQGKASAKRFFALSVKKRGQIESFLKSLVAPTAASAPGIVLAAELESRFAKEKRREPEPESEAVVRRQRAEAVAREEQKWHAAKRARIQFPIARNLEKMGRTAAAIDSYREIAQQAPDTDEGRRSVARISALRTRKTAP